jgi:hypothetical protein
VEAAPADANAFPAALPPPISRVPPAALPVLDAGIVAAVHGAGTLAAALAVAACEHAAARAAAAVDAVQK